jgi:uncharacterized repeat protein (TIGR02543 family)
MKQKQFLASLLCLASCGAMLALSGCTLSGSISSANLSQAQTYSVTFDYNYSGSTPSVVSVESGKTVAKPADPTRTDYSFTGWFKEASAATAYDFTSAVTSNLTLYAGWLSTTAKQYTVTFNYNYDGAPEATTAKVEEGKTVSKPADPSRDGYAFDAWYADAACATAYDFKTAVNADLTLYAGWGSQYVFEAEWSKDVDLIEGMGYSGSASGLDVIMADQQNLGASNGFYISYLYVQDLTLEFDITSAKAVSNAKLSARLSAEIMDIVLTSSSYTIAVNDVGLGYSDISLSNVPTSGSVKCLPFKDFLIADNVSLKAGVNTIKLTTSNSTPMKGTMYATAPMVDCIKVTTTAALTWDPVKSNTAQ